MVHLRGIPGGYIAQGMRRGHIAQGMGGKHIAQVWQEGKHIAQVWFWEVRCPSLTVLGEVHLLKDCPGRGTPP